MDNETNEMAERMASVNGRGYEEFNLGILDQNEKNPDSTTLLRDNFLNFWFRFIYRNRSAIETGNFQYVRDVIQRDYATYSGVILERCFHELVADTGKFNQVGSYWERGNLNEIDLVAINDLKKRIVIADIKLNKAKLNIEALKVKAKDLLASYPGYEVEWLGLSIENIGDYV